MRSIKALQECNASLYSERRKYQKSLFLFGIRIHNQIPWNLIHRRGQMSPSILHRIKKKVVRARQTVSISSLWVMILPYRWHLQSLSLFPILWPNSSPSLAKSKYQFLILKILLQINKYKSDAEFEVGNSSKVESTKLFSISTNWNLNYLLFKLKITLHSSDNTKEKLILISIEKLINIL